MAAPEIKYFESPTGDDPLMRELEITIVQGESAYKFTLPRSVWLDLHDLIFNEGCQTVVGDVKRAVARF